MSLQHGLVSTGGRHRKTRIGRVMRALRTPCCACLWTNTSPFALVRSGPLRRRCIVRRHKFLCNSQKMTPISMPEDPSSIPSSSRPHVYRADEPLLPAVEGHKPWLTTFKVPSHATASIRYGHIPTVGSASSSTSSTRRAAQAGSTDDDRTRRKEREVKKRSEIVGRLTRAKESTLDYRLGITKNIKSGVQERPNPVSVKGWAGLVEARIEVRCVPSMIMKPDPSLLHTASKTRRILPHHQGSREAP